MPGSKGGSYSCSERPLYISDTEGTLGRGTNAPPEIPRVSKVCLIVREIERRKVVENRIERLRGVEEEGAHARMGGREVESALVELRVVDVDGVATHCCGIGALCDDLGGGTEQGPGFIASAFG